MAEDKFAIVESIFPTYYEPYEISEDDDIKVGEYNQTLITYRNFCNLKGRVCSPKAHTKSLDFCNWIKPLTKDQTALLEQIKAEKAKEYAEWKAKYKDASEYVTIYVDTEKGNAEIACSLFRKATKALPERFTYTDIQTILSSRPGVKADTANIEDRSKDSINFDLCYMPKEQRGKHLSFYRIKNYEWTFSTFINYLMVFASIYHLVRLYGEETGSEKLKQLAPKLKETFGVLAGYKKGDDSLAKDFEKRVRKVFYSFNTAYATMEAFLNRHSKELDIEDLVKLVKNKDENIIKLYHYILGC